MNELNTQLKKLLKKNHRINPMKTQKSDNKAKKKNSLN